MIRLSSTELDALVAEAIVDTYGEDEQCAAFQTVIEDCLALPFSTVVLGVTATVTAIQDRPPRQRHHRPVQTRPAHSGDRHPGPAATRPHP